MCLDNGLGHHNAVSTSVFPGGALLVREDRVSSRSIFMSFAAGESAALDDS